MSEKIRISQCMIVKNEEKNIERALSWGRDMMWEQIVVDTGSTDRTAAIAQEMGAKVFHFPWIDDFSAAKNFAIDQACGDWIAFLDADEYIPPESAKKIPSLLMEMDSTSCNALITSLVQVDGAQDITQEQAEGTLKWISTLKEDGSKKFSLSGSVIRLFRNLPGLRYEGRIHEKLAMKDGSLSCADTSQELVVLHTGYNPEEMKEKNKVERNIHLIKKELEDHPRDYKMLTCLADSYSQQKNHAKAAKWYEKAADCLPKGLGEDNIQGAMIFKHLLLIYLELSDEKAAKKAYARGTKRFPKDADYDYLMGRHLTGTGHFQDGAQHLLKALVLLDQHGSTLRSTLLAHNLLEAWELLIKCHYENQDLKQCVSCAVTVLKASPYRPEALKLLLSAFRRDEELDRDRPTPTAASPDQVKGFLGNFYDLGKEEDCRFVGDAARQVSYEELVGLLH